MARRPVVLLPLSRQAPPRRGANSTIPRATLDVLGAGNLQMLMLCCLYVYSDRTWLKCPSGLPNAPQGGPAFSL